MYPNNLRVRRRWERRPGGLVIPVYEQVPLSPAVEAARSAEMDFPSGTAVAGDPVATHLANSVEYQVTIPAHASGHMRGTIPTYTWWRPYAAGAANQRIIDIFNAAGSGVVVKLRKLFLHHDQSVQTGVVIRHDFSITSAVGTGGTVITGQKQDSNDAAIPAQVTARLSATGGATVSHLKFGFAVDTEETRPATGMAPLINWLAEGEDVGDIVLNEGQGAVVTQITSSVVGIWGTWLVATITAP